MLENKYNFEFPPLYKVLLEDGMLDYTAPHYLLDYKFFGADLEPFSFEESLQNYDDFLFWDKVKVFHLHKQVQAIGMDFVFV